MDKRVKPSSSTNTAERGRGRPRSQAARAAILRSAHELLEQGGLAAVTMEGVAQRAGVGKPTVYRSWSNRHELAMAALMEAAPLDDGAGPATTPLQAIRRQLHRVAALFTAPTGRSVAAMLAAADSGTEVSRAFRSHFLRARREEGRLLLEAAVQRGQLRAGIDIDVALDAIYGPIFYRLLMSHGALDGAFTDAVVDHVVQGIGWKTGRGSDRARPRAHRRDSAGP